MDEGHRERVGPLKWNIGDQSTDIFFLFFCLKCKKKLQRR